MKTNNKYQSLQSQLKEFGLNPGEWILKMRSQEEFLIVSTEDDGFQFLGTTRKGLKIPTWNSIQLISI